ncbi:hypothetical protein BC941DRAFT_466475 [Chlamydoabsidia padenii]|nr:hypothetical protein BC941DRAFT_466475 [Chlamydoabsidia padenii]
MIPLNVNHLKNKLIDLLNNKCHLKELSFCGESVVFLFNRLLQQTINTPTNTCIEQVDSLIDLANERILQYPYKDVPSYWRSLLMDASLLKALSMLTTMDISNGMEQARQLIKVVDTALIVSGCPGTSQRQVTMDLLNNIQSWLRPSATDPLLITLDPTTTTSLMVHHPIPTLHQPPDYLWFETHINQPTPTPLHLSCGLLEHWPALQSWQDLNYLLQLAGDRMVPIEIGSNYTDTLWQQKLVRMEDFIHDHILSSSHQQRPTAYLAQHDLFAHIPLLANDIFIPDYCLVEPKATEGYTPPDDVMQHAWFGPKGTVSPLHQDPYHNLFAQVVGRKYIRLYAPSHSESLYPYEGIMSNTSQVDLDSPDLDTYPRFAQADYLECVLEPGDMLYIPPKWWHYVRSLDTSFSVSFWF